MKRSRSRVLRARSLIVVLSVAFVLCLAASRGVRSQSSGLQRITITTDEGNSLNPSLSGDGRRIAFESTEDIAHAGGGDHFRAIRAEVSASASAPPTFIQMGGTRAVAPAISQDGSDIAFASKDDPLGTNPDGNSEIFLYDGATLRQITNTSPGNIEDRVRNGNFQPSISDDGRFIAFASNRDLTGLNPDSNLEIFVYDAAAHSFTQITNSIGTIGASDAKISGNGARIAYIVDNGATASAERDLALFDRSGGTTQVIASSVPALALTYGRAISDDGKRIVYAAETAANSSQVFLFDGRSNNLNRPITFLGSRVTDVPLHPTISGDGQRIAFATRRNVVGGESDGSVDLYTFDIPTSQLARVTNAPEEATGAVVSSLNDTGTLVAFNFPRVLSGTVALPELRNTSEIYFTKTAARPEFGTLTVLNGASFGHEPSTTKAVAPNSIAVALGGELADSTQQAERQPDGTFPTNVGGTTVTVNGRAAQIFFVSPAEVVFLVPPETATGTAEVIVTNSNGFRTKGTVSVLRAAPSLFTFSGDGTGEGVILDAATLQPGPFDPSNGQRRLIVFATGVRNASQTTATIGGRTVTVESVMASPNLQGLDEIHLLLPADLRGAGTVDLVVRADGRNSNPVTLTISGEPPTRVLVINEVLADPPTGLDGDANHDGVRDTSDDEFVEIVNARNRDISIGNFELLSRSTTGEQDILRHRFASGTILPAGGAIVVFGGGSFNSNNAIFGGAQVVKASTGRLSLANTGGVVTLRDEAGAVASLFTYGGSTGLNGNANQSLTRSPDVTGNFTLHQSAQNSGGRLFSPGTRVDGSPFLSPPIARIEVTPASATIGVGQQQQFTARAFDANGQVMSGVLFTWRSSNPAVATINEDGQARGVSTGTSDIRASARGVQSAPARLTVIFVPRVVTRIEVTPSSATIPVGGEQQFMARAFDQFDNEMTGVAFTFSSGNSNVATIDQTGLAKGVSPGTTTITATAQSKSGSATLNVTPPTVVINEVFADPPTGPEGDANHDGVRDSSDDEFVELVNSTGSPINITGWTLRTRSLTGTTETTRHTFADGTSLPASDAIVVFGGGDFDPLNPAFGGAQVVKASTGRLSLTNGGMTVIVRDASGSLVTQFTYGGETGLRADQDQSLTRSPDTTGEFVQHTTAAGSNGRRFSPGTKVDGSLFVPRAGRLTSITIDPASTTIFVSQTTQFTARALDQFGRVMTGVAITFTSSNTSVATVESVTTNPSTGVATATVRGQSIGSAQITASATQGATTVTSDPATLNVSPPPPRVSRVEVSPETATINRGRTQQFTATAFNSSNQVVSGVTFTWTSSDESIATVNQNGLATGVGIGTVTITATAPDGTVGTRSDQATLNVQVPLVLNEILADPATGAAGDANRDGVTSSDDDEFIEVVNDSPAPLNISGIGIFETSSPASARFTFPANTVLAARQAAVVFGGGGANFNPNNPAFGCSLVFKTGSLSLGNSSETVTIKLGSAIVASHTYGSEGGANQSLTRSPDLTGAFTKHTLAQNSNGRLFSPGVKIDNTPFGACPLILTSIAINPASATIFVSQTTQFTAQAFDQFGRVIKGLNISFTSSNTSVATVESVTTNPSTGVATATVRGQSIGSAQITASATQGATTVTSDPATLNVSPPPPRVSRVEVSPQTATINRGRTQQFTAMAFNSSNQVVSGVTFTWTSSDESIATVNQNGLATGVGIGTVTITATAPDGTVGSRSDQSSLTVQVPLVLNEILADPATGATGDANRDGVTSSDDDEFIEVVNDSSVSLNISGIAVFETDSANARFTFPANTVLAARQAAVVFGGGGANFNPNNPAFGCAQVFKTGSLNLDNTGETVTIKLGSTTIAANTHGSEGGANQSLTRSPDLTGAFTKHTLATGSNGRLFSPGVRVDNTPFGTCPGVLTSITISPTSATTYVGQTTQFTAQAFDQFGRVIKGLNISFTSSNTSVATVESVTTNPSTGVATATVRGQSIGSAQITASATQGATTVTSDPATLNVAAPPPRVTRIEVTPSTATINRGNTQQFTAAAFNGSTAVSGVTVTWTSSDTNVATIDQNGLATGVGIGTTTITATAPDGIGGTVSDTATLTVQVPLIINEALPHVPLDNGATPAVEGDSNRDGVRSSDDDEFVELFNYSTAPVDISGVVISDSTNNRFTFPANTTLASGRAVIVFGGGSPPANDPAFGGALIFTTSSLGLTDGGDTITVKLAVGGSNVTIDSLAYGTGNPVAAPGSESLTRSPDAEVGSTGGAFVKHTAATNAAGRVFSPGTRADGTPFGSPPITRIAITPTSASIFDGSTQLFTARAFSNTGGPEIEVLNVSFIWDSSAPTVATINPLTGRTTTATGVAAGSTTITARAGGQQKTAALTVKAVVASIELLPETATVPATASQTFTATARDEDGNAISGLTFTFSLRNPSPANAATITATTANTVTVRGDHQGSVTVVASYTRPNDGVTIEDTSLLTINPPPPRVTSLEVSPSTATINRGNTQQFTAAAFNGSTAVSGVTVTWTSSDTNVATIDQNGLATGVGIGTTTITATAPDGLGGTVSDTATLTVQVPLVINEILADPPTGITGDSNRDGTESSTQDEFIELVNNSSAPVDISGVVLSDSTSDRFTFPANTILAANRAVIIFGGGSPPANDPNFGGALVFTAGSLGLNNDGDTVTAKLAVGGTNVQIDQVIYGGANPAPAPTDQSLTRSPDLTGAFIQHTTPTDANGRRFSPGTRLDGTPFGSPPITRIAITPASATVDPNDTQGFTAQAFSNVGGPEVEVQNVSFIWASTNTSVATVSPLTGVSTTATAHASGSATIQARAGGQLGTATLNVNSPPPVLTSVTISPASATIGVGETQQFTAQARDQFGQPFGGVTITFASNNTAVATVVSGSTSGTGSATGTATGQSGGSAEIRATADDGTTSVTSTPATLTVTQVNAGDVVISEFRFRGSNGANDEFIELYNRTSASIVISGYKIYRSNGTGTRTLHKTIANGVTLGAGCHYLLTNSNATGPYNDSVVGDDTYATGITEDGGIAFARPSSDGTTGIIDQVGLSAGSAYKEGTPQTSLGNTTAANIDRSYERKPGGAAGNGQDTDDNLTDFQLINPSDPQNSFSGCINTTSPDLSIVKTDTPDPVDAGANITYTLVVTNNTASVIVPNVTVTDPLPSGTSLVSVGTLPSGWTRTDSVASGGTGTITFKRTNMPGTGADSTATFTITVKVALGTADGTVISNTASVASDLVDSAPGNNSDTETTTVQAPTDLSITKTVNDASPDVGDQVVFTLTLSNNGTDAATGVEVTDQLPSGFTFLSASPAAAYNSTTGVWTVGTVNGGTNSVLTITAEVTQAAASTSGATNTATITASDQPDPVTSNNQSSVTVKALRANLSLTKSDSADPVEPGDALTYTIVVTNHGPNTAEAVKVTDSLPSELTLVSCTAPGGSCTNTGNDIEVNYTSLANGASATVTIETTVSNSTALGTTLSNTATADAATFDGTTSNNTDTETTTVDVPPPPTANLSLLKEVNNEHPSVGQNVTFTISLFNTGPDSATGVEVTDKLPTGLDYVSHSASQGTYNNVTGIWAVGSVGVSNSAAVATLTIVATMNSGFFKINTAEVTASDQADPNSEPNNNDPFEDDQSSVAVTPPQANLELTKTANTTTPNVGQNVTFTLSLKNFGFSNATGVEVTDQLPSGLTFVTASPLAEYNSTTGVWTVGSINNGATRTLTITATVTSPGSKTNTAKVTASDQFDPNTTNNTSSVTVTPPEANLTISKSDTPDPVSVGNNITYTITVTNGGPDTAQNVSVTDSLPAELTFVSCAAPGGSCSNTGNNVTASYASLTNGASATITIVATVNRTVADNTTITNTAQATSATYDPSTPNSATTTTTAKLPLLVISRFYGGSGTTGIYRCDFVEIFNRGVTSVDFTTSNYSLQYAAAAGNVGGTGTAANLHVINTGSIDPGEYYLVQLNCGSTTVGTPVSGADSTGSINPSATDGKLALVIGTTALGVSCPSLPNTNIADFVGYGGASCSETAPTAALSATKVGVRLGDGCTDTDNNSTNFAVNTHNNTTNPAPAPRNNSSPVNNCP